MNHVTCMHAAIATVFALSLAGGARAGALDCAKPASQLESVTCARPALQSLHDRVDRAYGQALSALSPGGASALEGAQQSWLHFVERTCVSTDLVPSEQTRDACIERAMRARIDQLALAAVPLGSVTLTRVDRFDSAPAEDDLPTGPYAGQTAQHVSWPQLDAPASAAAVAWNRAQAEVAEPCGNSGCRGDVEVDYVIGCANERWLSLRTSTYKFPRGAAHGLTTQRVLNTVLTPAPRAMIPDDLFKSDSDWPLMLPNLVWQAYLDEGGPFAHDPSFEANVRAAARDPGHWLLTPDGLQVGFSSYEAGCYACGPGSLTVRWSNLSGLLAASAAPQCEVASTSLR